MLTNFTAPINTRPVFLIRATSVLFMLCITMLLGCNNRPADAVIHDRIQKLAGKDAFDCGHATTDDENRQKTACAMSHLNTKTPFLVQYRIQGTDAIAEEGFSFDSSGALTEVSAFSWGPAAPVGKFKVDSCDTNKLRTSKNEYLICY